MPVSVKMRDLEVRYGDRVALSGLDLQATAPAAVAVIGPNGSGKSTLLRALAGLEEPSKGTIAIEAPDPPALVLQSTAVDRSLPITVRETVALARYPKVGLLRRFGRADREAVDVAMERLQVSDLAGRQLHELSGGQRQRTLVAQGLAQQSDVLLLDEAVIGLDIVSQDVILQVIAEERDAGRLVLMTTHNLDDARRCDLVLLLATVPIAFGPPSEVITDQYLRRAFGGQFVRFGDTVLLDDPHHEHSHHDHPH